MVKHESIFVEEMSKEYTIHIGQSAQENENIIRSANPNDLWFHLDGMSGPHIIIHTQGDSIPKRHFTILGTLFRTYKRGLSSRFTVIYTEVRNVKLTNVLGSVLTRNVKTIKF